MVDRATDSRLKTTLTAAVHPAASPSLPLSFPLAWLLTDGPPSPTRQHRAPRQPPPLHSRSPPSGPHPSVRVRTRACACPVPLTNEPGPAVAPPIRHLCPGVPSLTPLPARAAGPWAPRDRSPRPRAHPPFLILAVDSRSNDRGNLISLQFCRFVKRTIGSLEIEPTILYSYNHAPRFLQREPRVCL